MLLPKSSSLAASRVRCRVKIKMKNMKILIVDLACQSGLDHVDTDDSHTDTLTYPSTCHLGVEQESVRGMEPQTVEKIEAKVDDEAGVLRVNTHDKCVPIEVTYSDEEIAWQKTCKRYREMWRECIRDGASLHFRAKVYKDPEVLLDLIGL